MRASRILVVEDDRVVARDLQDHLTRIGHAVVGLAARGEDALPLAIQSQPDLVLMDIRLEGATDGIDAAQQIPDCCRIPVVYLTAYADDQTLQRAGVTEPFGYLLKPYEDSQLRTTIEMALYKHAAERKLRESERRYAVTLSSIGDAVIATNKTLQITFMNPVAEALTGWSLENAVGLLLSEVFRIINEDSRETVESPAANVLRSRVVVGLANHTILLARDGREIPIDDCGSPIIGDHGEITGTVLVFRDISERRQTEAALRRANAELARVAQRTAMGELAAAIAHEVNQPLSSVITNASTALGLLAVDPPDLVEMRSTVLLTIQEAKRAADVIARLRTFFKRKSGAREILDLNNVVREVVTLTRAEIQRGGATLRLELASDIPPVTIDRVQLQQVLVNLITNAIEAMSSVEKRSRELVIGTQTDDGEVQITVRDSGTGLSQTNTDQIFDAFYTTKKDGMGMGLWISRSILESHDGRLWASGNAGPGATFYFTLPAQSGVRP
jgi:PAS domain S-box-containing protein